jgi:8-oxo-dGTP pyrophosphatase MutT (NUDIX family)
LGLSAAGGVPTSDLRLASTILLVRDARAPGGGIEVFMEQRHLESGFVGGAYVFPGGRVDPNDAIDPARCTGLDHPTADHRLGLTIGGLAHYVAAVRECFEEAGVLLAYDRSGLLLDFGDPAVEEHFKRRRDLLNAGTLTIQELADQDDLRLATDRLGYWSHWITPVGEPRRYDTRFFISHAPDRQTAVHDGWELTQSAWIAPRDAIERALRREWMIIFPTLMNLKALAQHDSADAAVAWAAAQPLPLAANQPKVFRGRIVLPGDEGYGEAETDLTAVDRDTFDRSFLP